MIIQNALAWAGVSVALALLSSVISLLTSRFPSLLRKVVMPLFSLSGSAATLAGLSTLIHHSIYVATLPFGLPWLHWQIRLDVLAGFFLFIIGIISIAVGIYGMGYLRGYERGREPLPALGGFTGLFLAAMLLVVLANDAFLFMVAWEVMSLSSYFLVSYHHEHAANRRAAFLYLLMAHIAGLAILLSFGVIASFSGSFGFDSMRHITLSPIWGSIAFTLAFIGFGMKSGLVPLHAWLPEAHPVAPSHISALMSGVMLKIAVYGFIRVVFDLLGNIHWQWGIAALIIGCISALMGVLYALMQTDLKRVLAYSSVENIGIIFIALGLAMLFLAKGHPVIGTVALIAALYHILNHALFKSLLFLGAGAILHSTNEQSLEKMGGLLRRMPWTGWFFLVGSLSIAALPPFNGFVSEWLTFQAALQAWHLQSGVMRSIVPIAAAILALTGALSAACFVRAYGIGFLGQARSRHVRRARQVPMSMRVGQGLLATLCLLFGIFPSTVISILNTVPQEILGHTLTQATAHGWLWLTPISAKTASYGAPMVAISLAIALGLGLYLLGRTIWRVKRCDVWDCGFAPPDANMQYTATGFAQPIRRVFGIFFKIEQALEGKNTDSPRYRLIIRDRSWNLIYQPIAKMLEAATRRVVKLQSGNLRVYLGWTLITLVVLLWIIA